MTLEKCREVLDRYDAKLRSGEVFRHDGNRSELDHLLVMIPKMREMLDTISAINVPLMPDPLDMGPVTVAVLREKFMRWLGFMQGVLSCNGVYTIDEMKDHNRP